MKHSPQGLIGMLLTFIGTPFLIIGLAFLSEGDNPLFSLVFAFLGCVFIGFGLYFLIPILRKRAIVRKVNRSGKTVKAVVSEVLIDPTITVNSAHPWVVIARYRDPVSGKNYRFRSNESMEEPVWIKPGMEVSVTVNPQDMEEYSFVIDS